MLKEVIHKHISRNWENISNSGPKIRSKIITNWIKRCIGSANLTEPYFAFSHDITMLQKWFIITFPGIEKISHNLCPNLVPKLWQIEHLMKSCIRIGKTSQKHFSLYSQDIAMLKKWFISSFPEIEKISENLGPNLGQKLWKIESYMKRCIGSAKPHRTVFRFFARYYDAEEVIYQHHFSEIEKISQNLRPKVRLKIVTNWIFNEKVHLSRKTSTEPFFAFSHDITMLKKWFISSFPEIEKISQNLGPNLVQKLWKVVSLLKSCIGSAKHRRTIFRFFARYYDAEQVIHQLISLNWENIWKSGPKLRPKIMKNWIFNEKVHRTRKSSQNSFSLFRKILRCWRSDS